MRTEVAMQQWSISNHIICFRNQYYTRESSWNAVCFLSPIQDLSLLLHVLLVLLHRVEEKACPLWWPVKNQFKVFQSTKHDILGQAPKFGERAFIECSTKLCLQKRSKQQNETRALKYYLRLKLSVLTWLVFVIRRKSKPFSRRA